MMPRASLQVRGADQSATKRKALEDAKKMQMHIVEESNKSGKEPPPYVLQELIGKGSYGRVYKASDAKDNRVVAVKIIDIDESDTLNPKLADTYREIMNEISALKLLSESGARNVNVVLEAIPVQSSMWIITEYCAGGSVSTLMQPTAPNGLQEKWIIPILREVAEAIYWVHRQGIIHRDIKCANVLITEAGGVQLCDFGVAGVIETRLDKRTTVIGTPNWMAPELFDGSNSYGTEVDIWAFGSLVFEVASGLPPNALSGMAFHQLGNFIKKQAPRLEGDQYSDALKDLVAYCLVDDPAKRPPIEAIQQHPYIFRTEERFPTSSLALLVRAYRLWESQGGSRKSLFNPGGAQGLNGLSESDLSSTALAADEWNFSTTMAFDQRLFDDSDNQAVYDVYGSNLGLPEFKDETTRPPKAKGRRRPPPQLPVLKAPLEKVFDPNTISNYEDNSRVYYGRPMPPPTASDLPLRDDSLHSTLRESLIDLDMSLDGSRLSMFTDMETIRASNSHAAAGVDYSHLDYGMDDSHDFNKAPLSDPADMSNNRRTQDWKFPSMQAAPLSANPEVSHFSFHDDLGMTPEPSPPPQGRPQLLHHQTDPVGMQSQAYNELSVPRAPDNRTSVGSLIDLDESLPDSMPELTRPSTANSDVVSVTGSDIGTTANPFEFERHASIYVSSPPRGGGGGSSSSFGGREPSIYVSDDSDFARLAVGSKQEGSASMPNLVLNDGNGGSLVPSSDSQRRPRPDSYDDGGYPGGEYLDADYLNMMDHRRETQENLGGGGQMPHQYNMSQQQLQFSQQHIQDLDEMPTLPEPPSARVMQGVCSRQEASDELQRMLASFQEHLSFSHAHVLNLPILRRNPSGGGGGGVGGGRLEPAAED